MFEQISSIHSEILDEVLETRRSVKAFSGVAPSKKDIELIIRAGLRTPFAGKPAREKKDFRRIFVIPTDSEVMKRIEVLLIRALANIQGDTKEIDVPQNVKTFARNAPYLIIAAERKGFPVTYMADNSISISYCMFGMWLKATTLKIGFKLVSAFIHAKMGNNNEFCQLIGLPCGEYALDACVIGYPHEKYNLPLVDYPEYESNVFWL